MSTTGHYPFSDIYAKIIFMQQGNERTFEQIKSIWRFLNCDVVIHKEVELHKIFRATLTLNVKQLFQMINEVEIFNTIDEIEVKDIYIVNDLIKSIENLPTQKDWRGITANGYKEPKKPKYSITQIGVINEFKTYLLEQKDIIENSKIEQPQQEDETPTETLKENLYNDYFKGNTFLLFKEYCETKEVDNTCRTDLRVLFQLFSEYGFFVDTMELKHYLKFLSTYLKYDSTELKKVDLNTKPNIKRTNDLKQIKNNLKITLK